jgi:acyl-coenzyme A synthetase/AMP-(fatty) acid ligase
MLGYLNAPSPFDNNGWFNTEDRVEKDGDWIRILGRDIDIINVGGQKVYPSEVESVLLDMDNIIDASVFPMPNPIMGNIVGVKINIQNPESIESIKRRIRKHCKDRMQSFKIPAHIEIVKQSQVSDRFKKVRK